jgi:hygromycin-B 7''-O-kinase
MWFGSGTSNEGDDGFAMEGKREMQAQCDCEDPVHEQGHEGEGGSGMAVYRSLGAISNSQWQAVADRFDLGRVRRATPFMGGYGNNVELECDSGLWVFSGRISRESFRRERFFVERIAEGSTVGVPWPYHIDDSEEIFDWTYSVMRHVGGEVVTWNQDRDWDTVARALGRAVAALHTVTFPAPAHWQDDGLVAFDGSQRKRFEGLIAELISNASQRGLLDDESEQWMREAVAAATVEGYVPTIVHHDLTRNNAHFTFEGDTVEVSGIFDLKECLVGDPDEDLARSLWEFCVEVGSGPARAFLDAYRAERPARAGEGARLRAYVIYDLLLIWVAALGRDHAETPKSGFGEHKTFRAWASRLVEPVERVLARATKNAGGRFVRPRRSIPRQRSI